MSKKGTSRKNPGDLNAEHELFLELVREKRPELEIAVRLNLSKVQMNGHILKALQGENVRPSDMIPEYEVVYAKGLPKVIRKLMSLESDDDGEALVKVELQDGEVLLTLLRAASPRTQPGSENSEESPVTEGSEEEFA